MRRVLFAAGIVCVGFLCLASALTGASAQNSGPRGRSA